MALVAAVNFRGVGESVKANVVLTLVELSGLLLVIFIGLYAITQGKADFSTGHRSSTPPATRTPSSRSPPRRRWRSSRWSASRTRSTWPRRRKDPSAIFPKIMLTGLGITGIIYILVSITAVALVPVGDLDDPSRAGADAGRRGGCTRPADRQDLPVHHHVRGRQLRADQHADGQPAALRHGQPGRAAAGARRGAPQAPYAVGLDHLHHADRVRPDHLSSGQRLRERRQDRDRLGGTTALLLLGVFTVVNIAVLGPAPAAGRPRALPRADLPARTRRRVVLASSSARGPGVASRGPVQDRAACCSPSASCCGRSPGW